MNTRALIGLVAVIGVIIAGFLFFRNLPGLAPQQAADVAAVPEPDATATPEPTVTPEPTATPEPTETPPPATATPTAPPPLEPETRLILYVPDNFAERFKRQAEAFSAATGIGAAVNALPAADYNEKIQVMLAAGEPVDLYLAGVYNPPAEGWAIPLDDYLEVMGVDPGSYLPPAMETFTVAGRLLALPVEAPPACEPFFRALAIGPTSAAPEPAAQLLAFLAAAEQQMEAFTAADGQILPTLTALYDELGIVCPPARRPVPPLPGQSAAAQEVVEANKESLRRPLNQYAETLKKYEIPFEQVDLVSGLAVAAERPGDTVGSPVSQRPPGRAALLPQPEETNNVMVAALAPINVNVTDEQAALLLTTTPGLILGGAFGVLSSDPPFVINEYVLQPGDNVLVAARAAASDDGGGGLVDIYIIDSQGGETYAGTQPRSAVQNQVPVPLVIITEGSCWIDWRIDKMLIQAIC